MLLCFLQIFHKHVSEGISENREVQITRWDITNYLQQYTESAIKVVYSFHS